MKKFVPFLILTFFACTVLGQTQERFGEEEEEIAKPAEEEPATAPKAKSAPMATPAKTSSDFWSRTRFGGNFGAGFSNGTTYINVSPRMYYEATEKLWVGTGFTFIYSSYKYNPPPYDESFVYGLNLFSTYQLFGPLFVQAEYEPLSFEQYLYSPTSGNIVGEQRIWIHGLFVGGGITQSLGGSGVLFISALYNVTWRSYNESYYGSPWVFRIGFGI